MIGAFITWWYGQGWRRQLQIVADRNAKLADMFSLDLLLRTMFAPFRQIGTGSGGGSLEMKLHAWADLLFSRLVGAAVRSVTLLAGSIVLVGAAGLGALQLIGWMLLPLAPIAGIVGAITGWLPWKG